jgi:hypothetical protein
MIKPTDRLHWQRSSFCASNACVEVARAGGQVLLRDSKDPERPPLEFTPAQWAAFLDDARGGEFDFG